MEELWVVLKCYQLLGSFPLCKDSENSFVAIKTWKYFLTVAIVSTLIVSWSVSSMAAIGYSQVFSIVINDKGSLTDFATFCILIGASHSLNFSIVWNNFQIKKDLAGLLNALKAKRSKPNLVVLFDQIMSLINIMLCILGFAWMVRIEMGGEDVSAMKLALFMPPIGVYMLWLHGPPIAFVIAFSNVCGALCFWIETIKKMSPNDLLTVKYFSDSFSFFHDFENKY